MLEFRLQAVVIIEIWVRRLKPGLRRPDPDFNTPSQAPDCSPSSFAK
jgi:hypothetical protein